MSVDIIHTALESIPPPPELHYHEGENGIKAERLLTCAALYDGSPVGNWLKRFCEHLIWLSKEEAMK